jgi:hypothetical protein
MRPILPLPLIMPHRAPQKELDRDVLHPRINGQYIRFLLRCSHQEQQVRKEDLVRIISSGNAPSASRSTSFLSRLLYERL